jgi:hypothetical protein
VFRVSNIDTRKSVYFSYFYPIMKHGIIFGITHLTEKIFTFQKRIIRLLADGKPRNSYKSLFKRLEVLTLPYV